MHGGGILAVSDRRFHTLDAMRGVAALIVVSLHWGQIFRSGYSPCGFLAVDLFFVLSGFVIAVNYDDRFRGGLSAIEFLRLRAARLYPLFALGLLMGIGGAALETSRGGALTDSLAALPPNIFGFPDFRVFSPSPLFPGNNPLWSIFFEFWIANLIYAFAWRWINLRSLIIAAGLGALGLLICNRVWFSVSGGWNWPTMPVGFARVLFGFSTGILIARLRLGGHFRVPAIPLPLLVAAMFAALVVPFTGKPAHLYEAVFVLLIAPALVFLGSHSLSGKAWIWAVLGEVSYGLYALHYPVLHALGLYWKDGFTPLGSALGLGAFVFGGIAVVTMVVRYFDIPVRRALTKLGRSKFPGRPHRLEKAVP